MILPVYTFGQPILKKKADPIDKDYPELKELIANMWETMYEASGVGIAAPQIGISIRLFIIDSEQIFEDKESDELGFKKVFINAEILEESGEFWSYEEGCLSIPHIRGDVERQEQVTIKYLDENFKEHPHVINGCSDLMVECFYENGVHSRSAVGVYTLPNNIAVEIEGIFKLK